MLKGEKSPRALFTNDEVLEIRKLKYSCKYSYKEAYSIYKSRCSEGCFHKIWNYETYSEIGIEYNTSEVINHYKTTRPSGSTNSNCKFSKEDVIKIRTLYYVEGISTKEISCKYSVSESAISRILNGKTYSDVEFPEPSFKYRRNFKKYTNDELNDLVKDFNQSHLDMKNYYLTKIKDNLNSVFGKFSLTGFVTQLKKGLNNI